MSIPRPPTTDGQFHDGDPATGTLGTIVSAAWLNAVMETAIGFGGDSIPIAAETTLDETVGRGFITNGAPVHLPVFATVSPLKEYRLKVIDGTPSVLNCADGKTVDGQASIPLNPGDRVTVVKDPTGNWQTI